MQIVKLDVTVTKETQGVEVVVKYDTVTNK